MTKFSITGNWDKIRKKLQDEYPDLTDADLAFKRGEESQLIGRIEKRIGGEKRDRVVNRIMDLNDAFP
ncbi:MAG: hypothetical protein ACLFUC_10275 [Bacteroidales bacterium]